MGDREVVVRLPAGARDSSVCHRVQDASTFQLNGYKYALGQAMKSKRDSRCIVLLFNLGARRGWLVNATPRPLYPRERDPVFTVQEAGCTREPFWTGAENLAPTGVRSPDRPARSEPLCRLRYPIPL